MNFSKIKETCIYFRDLSQAEAFYHGLLGLRVIGFVKDKHIFFRAGGSVLLCFNPEDSMHKKSPPAHYGSGKLHFAFEVPGDRYEAVKKEIQAKGISITAEIVWESGRESFYFEDPEGHVLEVVPDKGIWD